MKGKTMTVQQISTSLGSQDNNHNFLNAKIDHRQNSWVAQILNRIANFIEVRKQRRIDRLAFKHMLTLDEEMLKDIGVTRDDVIWASKLPLEINASRTLEEARRSGHI